MTLTHCIRCDSREPHKRPAYCPACVETIQELASINRAEYEQTYRVLRGLVRSINETPGTGETEKLPAYRSAKKLLNQKRRRDIWA